MLISIALSHYMSPRDNAPFHKIQASEQGVNLLVETLIQKLPARTCLLTIAEVSELLGFHDVTLRDWARAGRLSGLQIGGQWRFDPTEPAAWAEVRRMG